jgi:hypothetical protein
MAINIQGDNFVVKSRPVKKCSEPFKLNVLSRVRGSMTNNNGFRTG